MATKRFDGIGWMPRRAGRPAGASRASTGAGRKIDCALLRKHAPDKGCSTIGKEADVDRPRGEVFHTNWTGRGGETASGAYNA